jgi:hypothetical protein
MTGGRSSSIIELQSGRHYHVASNKGSRRMPVLDRSCCADLPVPNRRSKNCRRAPHSASLIEGSETRQSLCALALGPYSFRMVDISALAPNPAQPLEIIDPGGRSTRSVSPIVLTDVCREPDANRRMLRIVLTERALSQERHSRLWPLIRSMAFLLIGCPLSLFS